MDCQPEMVLYSLLEPHAGLETGGRKGAHHRMMRFVALILLIVVGCLILQVRSKHSPMSRQCQERLAGLLLVKRAYVCGCWDQGVRKGYGGSAWE